MRWISRGLVATLLIVGLLVGGGLVAQRSFESRCQTQSWPGKFLAAPGGPVHVWCEGTGAPVVILESSGLASSAQYAQVLPELAHRTMACAWDRPGMGLSEPTDGGTTENAPISQ